MPVRSLRDGVLKLQDGTGTPNEITVALEDGGISYTETNNVDVIMDRGVLDHVRQGDEAPVEISVSLKFQSFIADAAPTVYEALTQTGDASSWASTRSGEDVYTLNWIFEIQDTSNATNETLTFSDVWPESIDFAEGTPFNTLEVSGRALITAPSIA